MNLMLVFIGGGLGSVLRYLIGAGFQKNLSSLPLATFIANVSACAIFALVVWLAESKAMISPNLRLLVLTGFCGGLSTFSAFGFETFLLIKNGLMFYALLNVIFSTGVCLLLFYLLLK